MLLIRAKLLKINTGDRNYLVFESSYYSKTLDTQVPSALSVMVDDSHLSRLADWNASIGQTIEVQIKPALSKKNQRIFYVTTD